MKRLVKKLCLFMIPMIVLSLLFFIFEPFDYFLLRGDSVYSTRSLAGMREVVLTQPERIILGDSRMANLNIDYIREVSGKDYVMMGYGGASVGDCMELFWFATEHTQLTEVVFGVGFYTSRGTQTGVEVKEIREQATNPWAFYSLYNNWIFAMDHAKTRTVNLLGKLLGQPQWIDDPYAPANDPRSLENLPVDPTRGAVWRANIEEYANLLYSNLSKGYTLEDSTLQQLQEVIDYCDENGIQLTFVFAPMHVSVYYMVLEPLGIEEDRQRYKRFLMERADVLDFEFNNVFCSTDSNFYDGFHLTGDNKAWLAEMIFTDAESPYVIRYTQE